jgi:hypothetical protein
VKLKDKQDTDKDDRNNIGLTSFSFTRIIVSNTAKTISTALGSNLLETSADAIATGSKLLENQFCQERRMLNSLIK